MRDEYDFTDAARGPAVQHEGQTRITILIDDDVLAAFRTRTQDTGRGYQAAINQALREYLGNDKLEATAPTRSGGTTALPNDEIDHSEGRRG